MNFSIKKVHELTGHSGSIYKIDRGFSNDYLASISGDRFLAQWKLHNYELDSFSIQLPSPAYTFKFVDNENPYILIGLSTGNLIQVDQSERMERRNIALQSGAIFSIEYFSGLGMLVVGTEMGDIYFFESGSLVLIKTIKLGGGKIRSIIYDEQTKRFYCSDGNGKCHVVLLENLTVIHSFLANQLSCNALCLSLNQKQLITGGRDAYVNIYDTENFDLVKSIPAHNYAIYSILHLPSKNIYVTASRDKTLKLWEGSEFDFLLRIDQEKFSGHSASVNSLVWNEERNLLFSAGDDRKIICWLLNSL